ELTEPGAVLGQADPEVRAARVVEHRKGQPRLHEVVGDLRGRERRLPRVRPLLVGLERVRGALTALLVGPLRRQRLGADDEREIALPAEDAGTRVLDEHLRCRATDARVPRARRARADARAEPTRRVVVLPRLAEDD